MVSMCIVPSRSGNHRWHVKGDSRSKTIAAACLPLTCDSAERSMGLPGHPRAFAAVPLARI